MACPWRRSSRRQQRSRSIGCQPAVVAGQVDEQFAHFAALRGVGVMQAHQRRAFDMLTSNRMRQAFDLTANRRPCANAMATR